MERVFLATLQDGTPQIVMEANSARKGFIIDNLSETIPVIVTAKGPKPGSDVDQVQDISFSKVPTSGSFKFRYFGQESVACDFDFLDSDVQTQLRLIPGLENVVVTAVAMDSGIDEGFSVTMTGAPTPGPLLEIIENTLKVDGQADVQVISFDSVPDAGTWKIRYKEVFNKVLFSVLTQEFAFDITSSELQSYLRGFFNDSTLTVTGDFSLGFTVTFGEWKGYRSEFTFEENKLTDGGTPVEITAAHSQNGILDEDVTASLSESVAGVYQDTGWVADPEGAVNSQDSNTQNVIYAEATGGSAQIRVQEIF
jgi:hypothetical protein